MDKIIKFKKPLNRVFDKANDKCDQGDYLFALSSLLNEMEQRPENAEICAHVADIYTELGLYENAILAWFKYLLRANREDYWEAYNGLGANYYFLEENYLASCYFSKQLNITQEVGGVYADVLEEFLDEVSEDKKPTYKLIKEKSFEEKKQSFFDEVHRLYNEGEMEKAVELLKTVEKSSPIYAETIFEQGLILLKNDEVEKSYEYIISAINMGYVTLLAISLAIDLSKALETGEESKYLKMLVDFEPANNDEKYKKMTALYENNLEELAYNLAIELVKDDKFDANTTYVLGFLAFNKKDYKGSEKFFKTAYLLSGSYTSLYYLRLVQKVIDGKEEVDSLKVDFSVPIKETNEKIAMVNSLVDNLNSTNDYSTSSMRDLIDWAVSAKDDRALFPICWAFVHLGRGDLFEMVKEVLVNPVVSDSVKQSVITVICAETKVKSVKVVIDGIFKTITFNRPEFSDENRELFEKAYAKAVAKVYIFSSDKKYMLSIGAKELQKELISTGFVNAVTDVSALACAMYVYSGLNVFKNDNFYEFFGTDKNQVIEIIKLTESENEN